MSRLATIPEIRNTVECLLLLDHVVMLGCTWHQHAQSRKHGPACMQQLILEVPVESSSVLGQACHIVSVVTWGIAAEVWRICAADLKWPQPLGSICAKPRTASCVLCFRTRHTARPEVQQNCRNMDFNHARTNNICSHLTPGLRTLPASPLHAQTAMLLSLIPGVPS